MRIAILADRRDDAARAVHREVARRVGGHHVVPVSPPELVRARWHHEVAADGGVTSRVRLPSGVVLEPDAVLHRLVGLPVPPTADAKDRDYVATELDALVASWLLGLGDRVLGSTAAYSTAAGPHRMVSLATAERCGLPVARRGLLTRAGLTGPTRPRERHLPRIAWPGDGAAPVPVDLVPGLPETSRLLVVAGTVHGPLAERYGAAALDVAAALGTTLLELSFADGPVLLDVTTLPRLDDAAHVHAVAGALVALAHRATRTAVLA